MMQKQHPLILRKLCDEVTAAAYVLGIQKTSEVYNLQIQTLNDIVEDKEKLDWKDEAT